MICIHKFAYTGSIKTHIKIFNLNSEKPTFKMSLVLIFQSKSIGGGKRTLKSWPAKVLSSFEVHRCE